MSRSFTYKSCDSIVYWIVNVAKLSRLLFNGCKRTEIGKKCDRELQEKWGKEDVVILARILRIYRELWAMVTIPSLLISISESVISSLSFFLFVFFFVCITRACTLYPFAIAITIRWRCRPIRWKFRYLCWLLVTNFCSTCLFVVVCIFAYWNIYRYTFLFLSLFYLCLFACVCVCSCGNWKTWNGINFHWHIMM